MAKSHNDFKPKRSRKSGLKKKKLVESNNQILKSLKTK